MRTHPPKLCSHFVQFMATLEARDYFCTRKGWPTLLVARIFPLTTPAHKLLQVTGAESSIAQTNRNKRTRQTAFHNKMSTFI